jgi:hypothetical protein
MISRPKVTRKKVSRTAVSLVPCPNELISEATAAAILGVSQQLVSQIRAEGKLAPGETAGLGRTRILYRRSDVERLRVAMSRPRGAAAAPLSPISSRCLLCTSDPIPKGSSPG